MLNAVTDAKSTSWIRASKFRSATARIAGLLLALVQAQYSSWTAPIAESQSQRRNFASVMSPTATFMCLHRESIAHV